MKFLRRIAGGLFLVLLLTATGVGLALWRASHAPVSLGLVMGPLREAASDAMPGLAFKAGDVRLYWLPWRALMVEIDGLDIEGEGLATPVHIQTVEIELAEAPLLRGQTRIRRLVLEGGGGGAYWDAGQIFDRQAGGFDYPDIRGALKTILDRLATRPLFRNLKYATLRDLDLNLTERQSGVQHQLHLDRGEFAVNDAKLDGVARIALRRDGDLGDMMLEIHGQPGLVGSLDLRLTIDAVDALLRGLPLKGWDSALHLPATARATALLGFAADDDFVKFEIIGGPGTIAHAKAYPAPRPVRDLAIAGRFLPVRATLEIAAMGLRIGEARVHVDGTVNFADQAPDIALAGTVNGLDLVSLNQGWPENLNVAGRKWVMDNISRGALPNAKLTLQSRQSEQLRLSFDISGLETHYLRPMPPATEIDGHGVLSDRDLRLTLSTGKVNGLDITGADILIGPFDQHPQNADIALHTKGPVQALLGLLDSPPFGFIGAYGFNPADAGGEVVAKAGFRFPLLKGLKRSEVDFDAHIEAREFAIAKLMPRGGLSHTVLNLDLDREGLSASGTGLLMGVASDITWRENFAHLDQQPSQYRVKARLYPESFGRLLPGAGDRFSGYADVEFLAEGRGREISQGSFNIDLGGAAVSEPLLGWSKPLDSPGSIAADFTIAKGVIELANGTARSAALDGSFNMRLDPEAGLSKFEIERLVVGQSALSGFIGSEHGHWQIVLSGASLDLRPAIEWLYAPAKTEGNIIRDLPDIKASATFDQVLLANDERMEGLVAAATTADNQWRELLLTGNFVGDGPMTLAVTGSGERRQLNLKAADAGRAARALDIFSQGTGGALEITAALTGHGDDLAMDGRAIMTGFRMKEAPTLARILSVGSLTGIADLVRDRGIEFRTVDVPFSLRRGVIDIDDASANGPALGLTMSGQFVKSLRRANLKGVVVPAYTLNSLIGNIPLLGDILAGGSKEGVFGINYRIEGNLTEPKISVNPVSMLTPGIFRRILSGPRGKVDAETPDPSEPSTPQNSEK